ncbi:hypothetical protein PFISCL1PPCAC_16186, partial [Pristionchus fissidentatus]
QVRSMSSSPVPYRKSVLISGVKLQTLLDGRKLIGGELAERLGRLDFNVCFLVDESGEEEDSEHATTPITSEEPDPEEFPTCPQTGEEDLKVLDEFNASRGHPGLGVPSPSPHSEPWTGASCADVTSVTWLDEEFCLFDSNKFNETFPWTPFEPICDPPVADSIPDDNNMIADCETTDEREITTPPVDDSIPDDNSMITDCETTDERELTSCEVDMANVHSAQWAIYYTSHRQFDLVIFNFIFDPNQSPIPTETIYGIFKKNILNHWLIIRALIENKEQPIKFVFLPYLPKEFSLPTCTLGLPTKKAEYGEFFRKTMSDVDAYYQVLNLTTSAASAVVVDPEDDSPINLWTEKVLDKAIIGSVEDDQSSDGESAGQRFSDEQIGALREFLDEYAYLHLWDDFRTPLAHY